MSCRQRLYRECVIVTENIFLQLTSVRKLFDIPQLERIVIRSVIMINEELLAI